MVISKAWDFFRWSMILSAHCKKMIRYRYSAASAMLSVAQNGMTESIANVGSAMNVLDSQQAVAEENLLRMKSTLSDVQDVDYTEAITQMNKDMLALEAAQSSFAKISQLNLFDYIK